MCGELLLSCLLRIYTSPFSSRSYRFTLDDLYPMMSAVKHRAELYDDWASRVAETLDARLEKKKGEDTHNRRSLLCRSPSSGFPLMVVSALWGDVTSVGI